jgi:hypothetical protein
MKNTNAYWILLIFFAYVLIIVFLSRRGSSGRLTYRAQAYSLLAYIIAILPILTLSLLFYYLNQEIVPTYIKVAGNSFLCTFIILNLIYWATASLPGNKN